MTEIGWYLYILSNFRFFCCFRLEIRIFSEASLSYFNKFTKNISDDLSVEQFWNEFWEKVVGPPKTRQLDNNRRLWIQRTFYLIIVNFSFFWFSICCITCSNFKSRFFWNLKLSMFSHFSSISWVTFWFNSLITDSGSSEFSSVSAGFEDSTFFSF